MLNKHEHDNYYSADLPSQYIVAPNIFPYSGIIKPMASEEEAERLALRIIKEHFLASHKPLTRACLRCVRPNSHNKGLNP